MIGDEAMNITLPCVSNCSSVLVSSLPSAGVLKDPLSSEMVVVGYKLPQGTISGTVTVTYIPTLPHTAGQSDTWEYFDGSILCSAEVKC